MRIVKIGLLIASVSAFASTATAEQIVTGTEKSVVVEMSNKIVKIGECVLIDSRNFINGGHFYTADFSITRNIKNKIWLKDAGGNVIPETETISEKQVTESFNQSDEFKNGDCVDKDTCAHDDSISVMTTCNAYRQMYLNHLGVQ